ncbi:MAG: hypothetical protein M3419_03335 [Actinomycetota bacterium]|nr:hypothetical protein [Actinomycetota bacterium]
MMTVSDRALRRTAWAVPGFLVAMIAVAVPLHFAVPAQKSWGDVLNAVAFAILITVFPLTGALILRRQPRNTIGWLLQGIGLVWCLGGFTDNYTRYALLVNPGSLPRPDVAAALNGGIWAPALGLMGTFLILLYPDGHLPSPRWRPVAWLSAVTILALTATMYLSPGRLELSPVPGLTNPLGWEAAGPLLDILFPIFLTLFPLCIVACAVALVRRFRQSHGIQRLQLKWLATAAAVVACTFLVAILAPVLTGAVTTSGEEAAWLKALNSLSFLSFLLLPAAIGVAILRHGLYEIDVIINRTLVYGSLTAGLAGVYLGSVLLLQLVLNPVTRQSDLAVAGSTLAVAALFRPARARIQATVDRRFYRSRYDAARTLDAFVHRLRSQLDLEAVGADLRGAVHETVQPAHVSLWLRP